MENKLFGIYIPTINRPDELKECLESFILQIKKYKFPIYIADQSKDGLTRDMITKLKRKYQYLHYGHFKANGYANNVKHVMGLGDTEYVWLFGDDDAIVDNAIDAIVGNIKENYDYLQINSETFSHDLKRVIKSRLIDKDDDEVYDAGSESKALLNTEHSGYQGFMAEMILRKKIVDKELKKLDSNEPNMDFIHTIFFFRGIVGMQGKLIAAPLIKNRGGNWGYSKRIMEIYFVSWNKTHKMLEGYYPDHIIEQVRKRSLFNLIIPITINKIMNDRDAIKDYKEYISNNNDINQRDKTILLIGMLIPRFILYNTYESYKKIKGY